jgi:hypothetical protein
MKKKIHPAHENNPGNLKNGHEFGRKSAGHKMFCFEGCRRIVKFGTPSWTSRRKKNVAFYE